jgi:molybdopterin synthase catalytic subunit
MSVDVSITKRPIPVGKVVESVLCPSAGGTAVFVGTVRDRSGRMKVERMILESAEELARRDLERIADKVGKRYKVSKIVVRHRVGELRVGDVIVAIAVSAPHRAEAFAACSAIIDGLKKSTPIWKKEIGSGRQRWVKSER